MTSCPMDGETKIMVRYDFVASGFCSYTDWSYTIDVSMKTAA